MDYKMYSALYSTDKVLIPYVQNSSP